MSTIEVFVIVSGVFWTLAYILIIRQSFRDRVYAMPFLALVMNLSWEFVFTFVYPSVGGLTQEIINAVWFLLDLGILYGYLRFWRADYPKNQPPQLMWPQLILAFALTIPMIMALVSVFGREFGSVYAAYGDNLIMSVLFITMLIRRGDRRGQSLGIAWSKLVGTLAASISQYIEGPANPIWYVLYVEILIFDVLYVILLARAPKYAPDQVVIDNQDTQTVENRR